MFTIRVQVMMTMMCCPPERATLSGRSGGNSTQKLEHAGGFECTMGEVPVVKRRDHEHVEDVHRHTSQNSDRAPSNDEHENATEMEKKKRHATHPCNLAKLRIGRRMMRCVQAA